MSRVVIGIGSNLEPEANVRRAVDILAAEQVLLAESEFERTEPIGWKGQPDFLNGAVLIETNLDREALRAWLRQVEARLGRVRGGDRYGPRPIDLDIVVVDGEVVDDDVHERDFLRRAVLAVWPGLDL